MKLFKVTWNDPAYGPYEKWQPSLVEAERYVEWLGGWWKEATDIAFCAVEIPTGDKNRMCAWLNDRSPHPGAY